ncbi:putative polysaccharide biosynthesis protein [Candidatus Epulonipiscium viviparus]|uniref:putative polysaccharide biosynthesis protein n=1 Tax=Candidatus Epulonipiscium viviparus TaxID=420336 RepID=UPI000495F5FA|nr:polysaccharide biosynthesis protein [Candidatus Epulopiscium viviparus]
MSKKTLLIGTMILTGASFITRILGFIFRIFLSHTMGAEGMGLYQLIFPIYMLAWAVSSAGVSLVVSKKVAEYNARGFHDDAIKIMKSAIVLSLVICIPISLFLFIFHEPIAIYFVHAADTSLSIQLLGTCLPFMATSCCIRGYFQGRQEMSVPAIAQVIEQVARMIIIYLVAGMMVPYGLEYACAAAMLGLCGGEFASCGFAIFMFFRARNKIKCTKPSIITYNSAINTIFYLSLPITANRFLTSALQSVENILIPMQLEKFGLSSSDALSVFGMYSGMAMPLLLFPSMLTGSLSVALIPSISDAKARSNNAELQRTVASSVQLSAIIGIGAGGLFFTLGDEIAMLVYNMSEVGHLLKLLALICPFFYLQGILNGVLNGLGLQKTTFQGNILGSVACIVLIIVGVPKSGLVGFTLALLAQAGIATCYHLYHALDSISLPINVLSWIMKPAIAISIGSIAIRYIYNSLLSGMVGAKVATVIAIALLGLFYITFLFAFKCITKEDIKAFL